MGLSLTPNLALPRFQLKVQCDHDKMNVNGYDFPLYHIIKMNTIMATQNRSQLTSTIQLQKKRTKLKNKLWLRAESNRDMDTEVMTEPLPLQKRKFIIVMGRL